MAHADSLPDDVLNKIASEVGPQLSQLGAVAAPGNQAAELGEGFSVWMLGLDAVTQRRADFASLVQPTGQWHHQVFSGNKATTFVRTAPLGPNANDWKVKSLFESEIAEKIDRAIDWVDKNINNDPLVRLLVSPAFYVHAFWLLEPGTSKLLVVDMPDSFTHLQYEALYSSSEFVTRLGMEPFSPAIK